MNALVDLLQVMADARGCDLATCGDECACVRQAAAVRTRFQVSSRARTDRRWMTPGQKDEVCRRWHAGYTIPRIVDDTGIPSGTIKKFLIREQAAGRLPRRLRARAPGWAPGT